MLHVALIRGGAAPAVTTIIAGQSARTHCAPPVFRPCRPYQAGSSAPAFAIAAAPPASRLMPERPPNHADRGFPALGRLTGFGMASPRRARRPPSFRISEKALVRSDRPAKRGCRAAVPDPDGRRHGRPLGSRRVGDFHPFHPSAAESTAWARLRWRKQDQGGIRAGMLLPTPPRHALPAESGASSTPCP